MNKLIKLNKIEEADKLVASIDSPHTYIYTIQMKGYTKSKDLPKATELLHKMIDSSHPPNLVTYNTYLTCALRAQDLPTARQIFTSMTEKDIITYSTYIRGLLKLKQPDEVLLLHQQITQENLVPQDQMYFNILINGLIKNKRVDQAFEAYLLMREKNFEQNEFSITVLIQLFNKLGNIKFLDILKNFKSKDQYFYSQIISTLIRNKNYFPKALEVLFQTMQRNIILKKSVYELAIATL